MPVEEVRWFDAIDVGRAPPEPGLYAWYVIPASTPSDWTHDPDPTTGADRGVQRYADVLSGHGYRLSQPPLELGVKWHLWAEWRGTIEETGITRLAELLGGVPASPSSGPAKKLRTAMHDHRRRALLASVLDGVAPRLVAPVYVGVATTLRGRLNKHLDDHAKAQAILSTGTLLSGRLASTFGARAAKQKIFSDHLRAGVLPLPQLASGSGLTDLEIRETAEAAEFVLNRWHHPILGEQ